MIPAISTNKYKLTADSEYYCIFCSHYSSGSCKLTTQAVKKFHKCTKHKPLSAKGKQNVKK